MIKAKYLRGINCKVCGKYLMTAAPPDCQAPGIGICQSCWDKKT